MSEKKRAVTTQIHLRLVSEQVPVEAIQFGEWATHLVLSRGPQGEFIWLDGLWDVTHVRTGMSISDLMTSESTAINIAAELGERFPLCTQEEVVEVGQAIRDVCNRHMWLP